MAETVYIQAELRKTLKNGSVYVYFPEMNQFYLFDKSKVITAPENIKTKKQRFVKVFTCDYIEDVETLINEYCIENNTSPVNIKIEILSNNVISVIAILEKIISDDIAAFNSVLERMMSND